MKNYFLLGLVLLFCASCTEDGPDADDVYDDFTFDQIMVLESSMSNELINSTHGKDNEIPAGTILAFRTGEGNYGKMHILNNTEKENTLIFRFQLFTFKNELLNERSLAMVVRSFTYDFEKGIQNSETSKDFWWEWNELNNGGMDGDDIFLVPRENCVFAEFKY